MLEMNSYLHVLNRICEEVQQDMANKSKKDNEIDWDVNVEVLFFYAMTGHKPVGVNRHFMMLLIHNKFSAYLNHEISSKAIWDHLDSMYDMAALHESEIIPFPNDEVDFELPEDCHDLLESKYGVSLKRPNSENESTKSNSNSRSSKKFGAPKLKQSSTPVSIPKSNFATPTLSKPSKSQAIVKNETKLPNIDVTPKVKQELGSSVKMNKFKHSSSPFSNKPVKYESLTMTKEDSPDTSVSKKNKAERGSSPAITKKPMKAESVSTNNASKKPSKSDSSNGSRVIRVDTPDNYVKKIKTDKELLNKKGKVSSTVDHTPSSKKKAENNNGIKKKNESESSMKKSTESSSLKHIKTDVKSSSQSSKAQEIETSSLSGSRKSSPVVKVKSSESSKKVKRSKLEEPKKSTPSLKRRRQ